MKYKPYETKPCFSSFCDKLAGLTHPYFCPKCEELRFEAEQDLRNEFREVEE